MLMIRFLGFLKGRHLQTRGLTLAEPQIYVTLTVHLGERQDFVFYSNICSSFGNMITLATWLNTSESRLCCWYDLR